MRFAMTDCALVLLALLSSGCGDSGTGSAGQARPETASTDQQREAAIGSSRVLRDKCFVSEHKRVAFARAHGMAPHDWYLTFDENSVTWERVAVQQAGPYKVANDGSITAGPGLGHFESMDAYYDQAKHRVLWDGMWYNLVSPGGAELSDVPPRQAIPEKAPVDEHTDSAKTPADALDGKRFISEKERERGLGPKGVALGHWYLTFRNGGVAWDHSDVRESAGYRMGTDDSITAWGIGDEGGVDAFYDRTKQRVLWRGMWYRLVSP